MLILYWNINCPRINSIYLVRCPPNGPLCIRIRVCSFISDPVVSISPNQGASSRASTCGKSAPKSAHINPQEQQKKKDLRIYTYICIWIDVWITEQKVCRFYFIFCSPWFGARFSDSIIFVRNLDLLSLKPFPGWLAMADAVATLREAPWVFLHLNGISKCWLFNCIFFSASVKSGERWREISY